MLRPGCLCNVPPLLHRNAVAAEHGKSVLGAATGGLKQLGSAWNDHAAEGVALALSVLERLRACAVLKGAPLELEKLWFNFARTALAADKPKQAAQCAHHLLGQLAGTRNCATEDRENRAPAGKDALVATYLPLPDDSAAQSHLSACAVVCYVDALARVSTTKLCDNVALFAQARAWVAAVAYASKRSALHAEVARVLVSFVVQCAKAAPPLAESIRALVKPIPWAVVLVALYQNKGKGSEADELEAALLRLAADDAAGCEDATCNEAFLVAVAKKMEDQRRALAEAPPTRAETLRHWCRVLCAYGHAVMSSARLVPYAVEAVGTAALLLAQRAKDPQAAAKELEGLERQAGSHAQAVASKWYNVGVALHPHESCVHFLSTSCRVLRTVSPAPPNLAERHAILSLAAEKVGLVEEALHAALWQFAAHPHGGSAERVVHLWASDAAGSAGADEIRTRLRVLEDVLRSDVQGELREALLRACWRHTRLCTALVSELLPPLTGVDERAVERWSVYRALLLRSQGRAGEAAALLDGMKGFVPVYWSVVVATERGGGGGAAQLTRLADALQALEECQQQPSAAECDALRSARYFCEWRDADSLAKRCHLLAARSPAPLEAIEQRVDAALCMLPARACEAQQLVDEATAQLATASSDKCVSLSHVSWLHARCAHAASRCELARGDTGAALRWATTAVQRVVGATGSARLTDSDAAWLSATDAQWSHLVWAVAIARHCGELHEHVGMVLEAEYLWSKARACCTLPAGANSYAQLTALLCTSAVHRRDAEAARLALEALDQNGAECSERALCAQHEARGDWWMNQIDGASQAVQWYERALGAAADSIYQGQRTMLLVKRAAVQGDSATWEHVEVSARDTAPHAAAMASYLLGCHGPVLERLRGAATDTRLSVRIQRRAALAAASLGDASMGLLANGLTYKYSSATKPSEAGGADALAAQLDALALGPDTLAAKLPPQWVMVNLSVVEAQGAIASGLLVTRVHRSGTTSKVLCSGEFATRLTHVRRELGRIIAESDETTKRRVVSTADKKRWWSDRQALDGRLKTLLCDAEATWLGAARGLLRPVCCTPDKALALLKAAHAKSAKKRQQRVTWSSVDTLALSCVAAAAAFYSDEELEGALVECCAGALSASDCAALREAFAISCEALGPVEGAAVVLVVGAGLEALPWESMPVLRTCCVTRMPSVAQVCARLSQVPPCAPISGPRTGYYVLNPSADLNKTQRTFEADFRDRRGWSGVAGSAPAAEELIDALTRADVFVYCGHNSGEQYLRREQLERAVAVVRPVTLLMGCSSAALRDLGSYEPAGVVLSYVQARCPALVGNLWDVTDSDCDRCLAALLQAWLDDAGRDQADLLACVAAARDSCVLKYLIGAAVVTYGLPQ